MRPYGPSHLFSHKLFRHQDVVSVALGGPTEAINGRLEALRRNTPGSRNLTN